MMLTRRLILAFALLAGIVPAFAQVPAPVPALPDTERRTSYSISGTTCACNVNFALYGDSTDYQNWVEVWLNGARVNFNDGTFGWTITSPSGPLSNLARPISDAVLTFNAVQSGTVQIVGARRPRRTTTFQENVGVPTRNFNQILNDLTAQNREFWDKTNDMTGRGLFFPPGNIGGPLPSPALCASMFLTFDVTGLNPVCAPPPTPVVNVTVTGAPPTAVCASITGSGTCAVDPNYIGKFGGRLTLISGQPEMTADAVGVQTIWYAPTAGAGIAVPLLVGGSMSQQVFTSGPTDQTGLSLSLAGSSNWAAGSIHDVFAIMNGGNVVLATRAWDSAMLPATTQIANATPIQTGTGATAWTRPTAAFNGTVSQPDASSARVVPSNNGTLANCLGQDWGAGNPQVLTQVIVTAPTDDNLRGDGATSLQVAVQGSNDATNWQIIDVRNVNSSGAMGAAFTIPINISNNVPYRYDRFCITGNGTSNINLAQIQFYATSAPIRRLTKYNGILVNDAAITARINSTTTVSVPQYQATFLGTVQIDAGSNGQVSAYVNYGPSRVYNVWNAYNQRTITLRAGIPCVTSGLNCNYNLSSPANIDWSVVQGTTFSMSILIGYAYEPVTAAFIRPVYLTDAAAIGGYEAGIGIDTTHGFSGTEYSTTMDSAAINAGNQGVATVTLPPFFGAHTLYGVEKLAYATTATIALFADVRNTAIVASWKN